ncbi:MAG: carbon-nitrogen hydrolase family protein [Proteobacteria bacterium]|nr:carbon-nitrogen hydrolase family protein [Pseudomonadota bacterium]MDA1323112.1 carbon-nitrogen hydrolase family protein [Pseudomonadota bacterium]
MPLPRLTVATCQFPVNVDVGSNAAHIRRQIRLAAQRGADVAHFPEVAIAGYGYQDRKTEDWKNAWQCFDWYLLRAQTETIQQACRDNKIWAVVGSSHSFDTAERPTNCVYIFDDAGDIVSRYDKRRCSESDLYNYTPGIAPVMFELKGVPCGVAICLESSFPDIFMDYANVGVDLLFLSTYWAGGQGDSIHTHTIPQTIQGYAFTTNLFISVSNASSPVQAFPSFWVRRSGRSDERCRRNVTGMILSTIMDEPEKDELYGFIREFRKGCKDGSFYEKHLTTNPCVEDRQTLGA